MRDESKNHLRLSRFHIELAFGYLIVMSLLIYLLWPILTPSERIAVPIISGCLVVLHAVLARGCRVKSELARKLSVAIGVLMLAAFPIGTFLGFYFLPLTQWGGGDSVHDGNSSLSNER
ncbi:MAG: hypothetical protein P8173_17890 [Gammaproteobacteria bacterium]